MARLFDRSGRSSPEHPSEKKAAEATRLIEHLRADLARPLIDELITEGHPYAYFLEGVLYEEGGLDVPVNLERAHASYRKQAVLAPCAEIHLHVARVLIYGGIAHQQEALDWLDAARRAGNPPEVDLGYACFYEETHPPDVARACKHYRIAFFRGRFIGFTHLARLQRGRGYYWRSRLTRLVLRVWMPVGLLLIGKRACRTFS